jgi:hypothetical protein
MSKTEHIVLILVAIMCAIALSASLALPAEVIHDYSKIQTVYLDTDNWGFTRILYYVDVRLVCIQHSYRHQDVHRNTQCWDYDEAPHGLKLKLDLFKTK